MTFVWNLSKNSASVNSKSDLEFSRRVVQKFTTFLDPASYES
jgi:hypothetical protein